LVKTATTFSQAGRPGRPGIWETWIPGFPAPAGRGPRELQHRGGAISHGNAWTCSAPPIERY
jgi:hypothetical protein